jgi:hypothetical protein
MKLLHAVALASVGWYLMVPQSPDVNAFKAPVSQWNEIGSFDSAVACEKDRKSRLQMTVEALESIKREIAGLPPSDRPMSQTAPKLYQDDVKVSGATELLLASKCIASDDPRLAK